MLRAFFFSGRLRVSQAMPSSSLMLSIMSLLSAMGFSLEAFKLFKTFKPFKLFKRSNPKYKRCHSEAKGRRI